MTMLRYATILAAFLFPLTIFAQGYFDEDPVVESFPGARGIDVADIDGDGDLDMFVTSMSDLRLYWFENDGLGNYAEHVIDHSILNSTHVLAADLDNDGDVDAIASASEGDAIFWYENDGNQNFIEHIITSQYDHAFGLDVADVDSDGDLDVLGCAALGDEFSWFEQLPDGTFLRHYVGPGIEPHSIVAFDADGDGDMDIFGASAQDDKIEWWENDGNQNWSGHLISNSYDGAYHIEPVDLDQDGDIDFLSCAVLGDEISWFENNDSIFSHHDIGNLDAAAVVIPGDFNNDGLIDIAVGSQILGVAFYVNNGNQFFELHDSFPSFGECRNLVVVDYDGDNKDEFLASSQDTNQVSWFDYQLDTTPRSLSASLDIDGSVHLTWVLGNQFDFIEYHVYRDNQLIASPTLPEYQDQLSQAGDYLYHVTAIFGWGESDPSHPVTVTWYGEDAIVIVEDFEDGFPDDWVIQTTTTSATWTMATSVYLPGNHMLLETGNAGRVSERLITPVFDGTSALTAALEFDSHLLNNDQNGYQVQLSTDGALNWQTIHAVDSDESTRVSELFTPYLNNSNEVYLSFYVNSLTRNDGIVWAIDNVIVFVQRDPLPLELDLHPLNRIIPGDGGTLFYGAHLVSFLPNQAPNTDYWVRIRFNNGQEIGPLGTVHFTIQPFMDVEVFNLSVVVPPNAPAGVHTLQGIVENTGLSNYRFTDEYQFEKLGDAAYENFVFDPSEWPTESGFDLLESQQLDATIPQEYELSAAFPNPFNPTTSLSVGLPVAADLRVVVFNVNGQQVAELTDSYYSAGRHSFTFDGSNLASGIYFIHADVPGKLNQAQKIVLMK
jgi:FG-GAP-like repeat/Secretion system C-terminal sorting domain